MASLVRKEKKPPITVTPSTQTRKSKNSSASSTNGKSISSISTGVKDWWQWDVLMRELRSMVED